jgi:tyrosine-protein phosphatase OCA1
MLLRPPALFGLVEPGVYRCSVPQPEHHAFLARLRLRTVVLLSSELPSGALHKFFQTHRITVVHAGLSHWVPERESAPIMSDQLLKEALEAVLDHARHPLMLMCASGGRLTGIVVGCLRRLQHWSVTAVVHEYRRFTGNRSAYLDEQAVESFDLDLIAVAGGTGAEPMAVLEHAAARLYQQQQQQPPSHHNHFHHPAPRPLPPWFIDHQRLWREDAGENENARAGVRPLSRLEKLTHSSGQSAATIAALHKAQPPRPAYLVHLYGGAEGPLLSSRSSFDAKLSIPEQEAD